MGNPFEGPPPAGLDCPVCKGIGKLEDKVCPECHGTGKKK